MRVSLISPIVWCAYGGIFDYDVKNARLEVVTRALLDPHLWNDSENAQALAKEKASLQKVVDVMNQLQQDIADLNELFELAVTENDKMSIADLEKDLDQYAQRLEQLEFQRRFNGKLDANNTYLDIQAGSGGTEAQDWAQMLMRMYLRFGERRGFKTQLLDVSPGEVAGIKNATIKFDGEYAHGWLRTETGTHRLVRKSPFNANNKRHTSFSSVFVYPEVDDSIEIDINPADLRIDTYRASGAGGQHVNRTDSAVRITHEPTNTVVQCQSERSQHKNKSSAMKQLKAKLYELELKKRHEAQQAMEDSKTDISWGTQIRSYVLDESRIKDLRTGVEIHDTKSVLDGDLERFIESSLLQLSGE